MIDLTPRLAFSPRDGFELQPSVPAPWREIVTVAWAIGPSTHPVEADEHPYASTNSDAIYPVCGMVVVPVAAIERGLHFAHQGVDDYFCGKGCKLDYADDPTLSSTRGTCGPRSVILGPLASEPQQAAVGRAHP